MSYIPRTQSSKFRDGDCPNRVLAIYDNGGETLDRYTVYYKPVTPLRDLRDRIDYRGMSENPSSAQGFGIYGDAEAWQVAGYRQRVYRHSAKWSELPEAVKDCVRRDCTELDELASV